MKMGRNRKYNPNIPAHIEQDKIPRNCYWENQKSYWYHSDGKKKNRIAGKSATLGDLHKLIEEYSSEVKSGTFRWLSSKFQASEQFKDLAIKTQKNYSRSGDIVNAFPTKIDIPLGDVFLIKWNDPLVQKLVDKIAVSNGPTAANSALKYIRRVFTWGKNRGYCEKNPAIKIEKAAERQQRRLPDAVVFKDLIEFARVRGSYTPKSKGSCSPYVWCALIIGYELRARGIETNKLTDADISDVGIRNERVKGSKTNVTEWNDILKQAIKHLQDRRSMIWSKKKCPVPVRPSDRNLFITETGGVLAKSSLESAFNRLVALAIDSGIMTREQRFGLHDLKRRGVTDTGGTKADKQEATGHKSADMIDIYDHSISVVKPVSE